VCVGGCVVWMVWIGPAAAAGWLCWPRWRLHADVGIALVCGHRWLDCLCAYAGVEVGACVVGAVGWDYWVWCCGLSAGFGERTGCESGGMGGALAGLVADAGVRMIDCMLVVGLGEDVMGEWVALGLVAVGYAT